MTKTDQILVVKRSKKINNFLEKFSYGFGDFQPKIKVWIFWNQFFGLIFGDSQSNFQFKFLTIYYQISDVNSKNFGDFLCYF